MSISRLRFAISVGWLGACCVGCGSAPDEPSAPSEPVEMDPLVGTWRWTGPSPGPTALSITFKADNTLALVEQVQPGSLPAGSSPQPPPGFDSDSCVPVLFCYGTYADTLSEGVHVLDWAFTDGTKDQVSGCSNPSSNSPGVPLSDDEVTSFIDQGHLPPRTLTYDVSTSELRLTSADTSAGVGRVEGTTFTRAP
jgi:hypothetical protein